MLNPYPTITPLSDEEKQLRRPPPIVTQLEALQDRPILPTSGIPRRFLRCPKPMNLPSERHFDVEARAESLPDLQTPTSTTFVIFENRHYFFACTELEALGLQPEQTVTRRQFLALWGYEV